MHKKVIQTLAVGVAGVTAISSSSFSVYAEDISVASTVTQSEESEQETEKQSEEGKESEKETEKESEVTETEKFKDEKVSKSKTKVSALTAPSEVSEDVYSIAEVVDYNGTKSNAFVKDEVCYYTKLFISVTAVASADDDNVRKVEIIDNGTGSVVSSQGSIQNGTKVVLPITGNTSNLSVKFTTETSTITKGLGDLISDFKNVSKFVESTKDPSIILVSDTSEVVENNGKNFIKRDGVLTFEVESEVPFNKDSLKIEYSGNGEVKDLVDKATVTYENGKSSISINTSEASGVTEFSINVEISDVLGRNLKASASLYRVSDNGLISCNSISSNERTVDGSKTYVNSDISISLKVEDSVSDVEVFKDGNLLQKLDNSDMNLVISESGNYEIKVTNVLGTSRVYKLEDLEGISNCTSNVVIDKKEPEISIGVTGELINGYYKDDASVVVSAKDNEDEEVQVVTKINGKEISGEINLRSITSEDGVYNISVTSKDRSGNEASKSKVVKLDTENPKLTCVLNGAYFEKNGKTVVGGSALVDLLGSDKESGVKEIRIYKDGALVSRSNKLTLVESGEYRFEVEDNVGHISVYGFEELMGISSIVEVDSSAPSISRVSGFDPTVVLDGKEWYNKKPSLRVGISDDNLKSVKVEVNGNVVYNGNNSSLGIPLDGITDGKVSVVVTAEDEVESSSKFEYVFYLDTKEPEKVSASASKDYKVSNNIAYFKEEADVTVKAEDVGVGNLTYYLDGSKVNTTFKLSKGNHTITIKDAVGNEVSKSLSDLLGFDTSNYVVDSVDPVISRKSGFNPGYSEDSEKWFSKNPNLVYSITEENIESIRVYVNGKDSEGMLSDEGTCEIPVKDFLEGRNVIKLTVNDKAGNTSEDEFVFYVDTKAPTKITGKISESWEEYAEAVYFKKNPTIKISASDSGVGVSLYTIGEESEKSGEFSLGNGTYELTVEDLLGNAVSGIKISDLMGWSTNNLIIDGKAPRISRVSGFSPDLRDSSGREWYSRKPNLVVSVTDDYMRSIQIKVNGGIVLSKLSKDGNYSIDLSSVGDGKVDVEVVAIDKAGNSSSSEYVFYLDRTAPSNLSGSVDKSYIERDTGVFFKQVPTLSLSAYDSGIGVKEYGLDNQVSDNGRFSLTDGEHSVYVVDELGNRANNVSVGSLLGTGKNRIVVDGVSPVINCKRPSGDYNGWYSKDQVFNATVSDNIAVQSATMVINGVTVDSYTSNGKDDKSVQLSGNTSRAEAKSDGSYEVVVRVMDKAGNETQWSDTIQIDKTAPTISRFVFTGVKSSGATINGGDRYGFFSEGVATVKIYADDGNVTSGLSRAVVNINGSEREVNFVAGVATVILPSNTKGFITAYAVDNVGNKGSVERPDGFVSESSNYHENSVDVLISLPSTDKKDSQGLPLYNKNLSLTVLAGCKLSGISSVRWGIGSTEVGSARVDSDGNISGNVGIKTTDRNLVLTLRNTLSVVENSNNIIVWVEVTDRLGHTSEDRKSISIDTDIPVISMSYEDGAGSKGYYSSTRKATITVRERNFDKDGLKVTGVCGTVGSWRRSGDTWTTDISFDKDRNYDFSISYTDLAGNTSRVISDKFCVDTTVPRVSVEFDNNTAKNKKYYSKGRTATITVVDANFDESNVSYVGSGVLSHWRRVGNTYKSTLTFVKDGGYAFTFKCKDKAGNESEEVKVDEFIVDKTKPVITITGVSDGISYKQNVPISVGISDENLDRKKVKVELKGKKNGIIQLESKLGESTGLYSLKSFDDSKEYDDIYTLEVEVYDLAGNVSRETVQFALNRYGSAFKGNENIFGNYLNKAEDIEISEQNLERLDVSKCSIVVIKDGRAIDLGKEDYSITEEEEEFGWKYLYRVNEDVFSEDGTYQIQVYSVSLDGTDYSSLSKEYTFMLDTKNPEVLISGIESGEIYREYSRTVTVDVRDASGVDSIRVFVNGSEVTVGNDGDIYSFGVVESSDLQNVSVEVIDKAGNKTVEGVNAIMITSNVWLYAINQTWFKVLLGSLGAIAISLIGLLTLRGVKSRKKEKEIANAQRENIEKSRSSSSGSSNK